jgi:hypothetical protein
MDLTLFQLNKIHKGNKKQVKYKNNKLIPSKPKYIFKFKDGIIIIFVIN